MTASSRLDRARPLAFLWLLAALLLALPGWLLLALSEGNGGRLAGSGITAAAGLALFVGIRVWAVGRRAVRQSYWASALLALAGVAAVAGVAADGPLFGRDALLVGGLPAALAAITSLVAALGGRKEPRP